MSAAVTEAWASAARPKLFSRLSLRCRVGRGLEMALLANVPIQLMSMRTLRPNTQEYHDCWAWGCWLAASITAIQASGRENCGSAPSGLDCGSAAQRFGQRCSSPSPRRGAGRNCGGSRRRCRWRGSRSLLFNSGSQLVEELPVGGVRQCDRNETQLRLCRTASAALQISVFCFISSSTAAAAAANAAANVAALA